MLEPIRIVSNGQSFALNLGTHYPCPRPVNTGSVYRALPRWFLQVSLVCR